MLVTGIFWKSLRVREVVCFYLRSGLGVGKRMGLCPGRRMGGIWYDLPLLRALFFAPKGMRHGPHNARTEVISLTSFDGPLAVE